MADSFAQSVKAQTDIVRIVGDYIKLRKSGANWSALCPFHKEKSGSFCLYPGTASFYCFGCHEHGDVFTFVMKMESLSFPEAVRAVATKMGIALPKQTFHSAEEAREAGLRKQLVDVHEAATQYFQGNLHSPEAARAREYMTGRGISEETIKTFRMGYAPDSFNDMRERMAKFFPEDVLRASGLFSFKEGDTSGSMYAKFRKRVMFPICNEQGKPIAFTGRALETTAPDGKTVAKYMNSPETLLYTKGQVLFNLDKAKNAIRTTGIVNLVEGQMDCISVFMGGVLNVIASSGTAFTEYQVALLRRHARIQSAEAKPSAAASSRFDLSVVLNFDPDFAGSNATQKTIELLVENGFNVRVIKLPNGLDPDQFVREYGIQEYVELLKQAKLYADFLLNRAQGIASPRTPQAKVDALNFLLPHIRRMPNVVERAEFVNNAAQRLGIEQSLLLQELKQAAQQRLESVRAPQPKAVSEIERILLCALVLPDADSARQLAAEQLAANADWYSELPCASVIEVLANAPAPENPMEAAPDVDSRVLLASALHQGSEGGDAARESLREQVENALRTLHERRLERRARELRSLIAEAQRRGDEGMLLQLAHEKLQVERSLRSV